MAAAVASVSQRPKAESGAGKGGPLASRDGGPRSGAWGGRALSLSAAWTKATALLAGDREDALACAVGLRETQRVLPFYLCWRRITVFVGNLKCLVFTSLGYMSIRVPTSSVASAVIIRPKCTYTDFFSHRNVHFKIRRRPLVSGKGTSLHKTVSAPNIQILSTYQLDTLL